MSLVVTNIAKLVNIREHNTLLRGAELAVLPVIDHAYIEIDKGKIKGYGPMSTLAIGSQQDVYDAKGATVLPAWCDSHTHLVFAASRENEFVDKIRGVSYAEIAAKGGGILNSAKKLNETSEDALFELANERLQSVIRMGTGAIEIKSGYGLCTEGELKMLRVIKRLKEVSPIPVKATFLGAHTYPAIYQNNHEGYIDEIIQQMLPAVAAEGLADFIDVFCEDGFFNPAETKAIGEAGIRYGLKPKIHANQLNLSGGTQTGVALGAISVDHLETMDDAAIGTLANSSTIGTLLPTAAFFLRMPFQPARKLIDAGVAIAIASDYNPGSSPSGNMNLVVAMGCIGMRLLPEEAINAATIQGAFAMGLEKEVGSITISKRANLIFTQPIPSLAYLPYSFGTDCIDRVMIDGAFI